MAQAGESALRIELPAKMMPRSAEATATVVKLKTDGQVDGQTINFTNLLPDTPYTVKITMEDGTTWQGVDLAWYNAEPAHPEAGPITDDDLAEIRSIITDVPSFYNKCSVVDVAGNHDRATVLVQLVRDKDFHAGAKEVIWRMELWYFKFEAGGWAIVPQQNKVLQRIRFHSHEAYHRETAKIKWMPKLGGIRLAKDKPLTVIAIAPPTTRPAKDAEPSK
jgi:hypothetical protein